MTDGEKDNEAAVKINELLSRVRDIVNSGGGNGNAVQTVVHQGLGAWGPAAIVACFCSMLLCVGLAALMSHENDKLARRIETLEAWQGVMGRDFTKMQTTIEYINQTNKSGGK